MFRALGAHLQEDTIIYMQHMVLSLCTRVRGGLTGHHELLYRVTVPYAACI